MKLDYTKMCEVKTHGKTDEDNAVQLMDLANPILGKKKGLTSVRPFPK